MAIDWRIEQFLAVDAVEALDIGILVGFPNLDVLDGHAGHLDPLDEWPPPETLGRCRPVKPAASHALGAYFAPINTSA